MPPWVYVYNYTHVRPWWHHVRTFVRVYNDVSVYRHCYKAGHVDAGSIQIPSSSVRRLNSFARTEPLDL